jgi:hypothetical protein
MPRKLLDDLRADQFLKWNVVRGKCSYGDNHESVRQIGDQWWGEDGNSFDCPFAPQDVCEPCGGLGYIEIEMSEAELAQFDGPEQAAAAARQVCTACDGTGFVPGPHWPWRHPHPGPVLRG